MLRFNYSYVRSAGRTWNLRQRLRFGVLYFCGRTWISQAASQLWLLLHLHQMQPGGAVQLAESRVLPSFPKENAGRKVLEDFVLQVAKAPHAEAAGRLADNLEPRSRTELPLSDLLWLP